MTFDVVAVARRRTRRLVLVVAGTVVVLCAVAVYPLGLYVNSRLDDNPAPATTTAVASGSTIPTSTAAPTASDPGGVAVVLPADTTWTTVGGVAVPVSATAGPRHRAGGLASGFAHTPAGAVVAAIHLLVNTTPEVGAAVFAPTLRDQVVGDQAAAMADVVAADYRSLGGTVDGGPVGSLPAALAGVRLTAYTDTATSVDLLTVAVDAAGTARFVAAPFELVWAGGDWRLVAPPGGRWDGVVHEVTPAQASTYPPLSPGAVTMSCSVFHPLDCVDSLIEGVKNGVADVAKSAIGWVLSGITDALHAGIKGLMTVLASWLLVPSTTLCPGADQPGTGWVAGCDAAASPAAQLRSWTLPITLLVAVLGLLWQAIMLTVTRRGEPLVQALRGLGAVAVWSAVGMVGTQLALRASDDYTVWILKQAIFGNSLNPTDTLGTALSNLAPTESFNALVLLLVFYLPILFITVLQIILMIFREGAVVILAGLLQLAAAGSFTRLTSGWLPKVTGWMLALIAYKPVAASVYATAFALMGANGLRNSITGLAVLLLAIVALPATMKFFNWTTGALAQGPSTLGMLGSAGAAGLHAASSMRGAGGHNAGDHAAFMAQHGPGATPPSPSPGADTSSSMVGAPSGATTAGPTGPASASAAAAPAGAAATGAAAGAATGGVTFAAQTGQRAADAATRAATNPPGNPAGDSSADLGR